MFLIYVYYFINNLNKIYFVYFLRIYKILFIVLHFI